MPVSIVELAAITLLGVGSGLVGALTGIGGGVILVPALVIGFGWDFPTAVSASLAAVIATSTTTGSAYVGEGLTNMRLAMTLEVATTAGGIGGGLLGVLLSERVLSGIFAGALVAAVALLGRSEQTTATAVERTSVSKSIPTDTGPLDARYFDTEANTKVVYRVQHVSLGMSVSFGAGIMSGLLGVGGGFIKVPTMNLLMGVPIRIAAATSNFMIGVTAVSSFLVYLGRGEVHPAATVPLILGTVVGGVMGIRWHQRIGSRPVRATLAVILAVVAVQMTLQATGVSIG